jgi:HSP20 family protein
MTNEGEDMASPLQRSAGGAEERSPSWGVENLRIRTDGVVMSASGGRADENAWLPRADVVEADGAYVIEVELPGARREDVDVALDGNEFVVTGEVKESTREGLFRRRTRRVGQFEFRVTLPGDLREDGVEVSLAYGVLKAYVPKAKTSRRAESRE